MASKKWDEAVNSLRQWREEILEQEEKEKYVIILAKEVVRHIYYDRPVLVRIRIDHLEKVEIDGKFSLDVKGEQIDIPSFKQILTESGFYFQPKEEKTLNVEGLKVKEVTIEVSATPLSKETDEQEG